MKKINAKHYKTLLKIFATPTLPSIEWRNIEPYLDRWVPILKMVMALGYISHLMVKLQLSIGRT